MTPEPIPPAPRKPVNANVGPRRPSAGTHPDLNVLREFGASCGRALEVARVQAGFGHQPAPRVSIAVFEFGDGGEQRADGAGVRVEAVVGGDPLVQPIGCTSGRSSGDATMVCLTNPPSVPVLRR